MNIMRLDLWKEEHEIRVKALLDLEELPEGHYFSFDLGSDYHMQKIVDSKGEPLEYGEIEKKTGRKPYLADRKKYKVSNLKDKQICIFYAGFTKAQHTMLTNNILSINGAGYWYPSYLSFESESWNKEVFIHLGKDYLVLNACFVREENAWHYQPQEGELFIIALKNYRCKTSGRGIIYYYRAEDDQKAETCVGSVGKLISYYEELYGYRTILQMPIVSLPIDLNAGAYNIDRTVVLDRFVYDYEDNGSIPYEQLIYMMGHEIAHNWCCGADSSWEDWLNETTAEWSSFSFLIENGYDGFVADLVKFYCDNEIPELIRTADGSHPQQVHIKGTLLFYSVYQKYGLAPIKDFLKAFVKLQEKNTANWITALSEKYPHIMPDVVAGLGVELIKDKLL